MISYKKYQKFTYVCMFFAFVCGIFNITMFFDDFLFSIFSLMAAVSSRKYYTGKVEELRKIKEPNEEIKKQIDSNIGVSYVAPLMLALSPVILMYYGIFE